MINRYKKSILRLINVALEASKDPFNNRENWWKIQKEVILKIKYIERRIICLKERIQQNQKIRKDKHVKLTRKESLKIKSKIKLDKIKISDYYLIIHLFKRVVDVIPFSFISKYDIKPQNFKEDAGFLNWKGGL